MPWVIKKKKKAIPFWLLGNLKSCCFKSKIFEMFGNKRHRDTKEVKSRTACLLTLVCGYQDIRYNPT